MRRGRSDRRVRVLSLLRAVRRLEGELEEVGGGNISMVTDPVFAGSDGGLALALDARESDWEKLGG